MGINLCQRQKIPLDLSQEGSPRPRMDKKALMRMAQALPPPRRCRIPREHTKGRRSRSRQQRRRRSALRERAGRSSSDEDATQPLYGRSGTRTKLSPT